MPQKEEIFSQREIIIMSIFQNHGKRCSFLSLKDDIQKVKLGNRKIDKIKDRDTGGARGAMAPSKILCGWCCISVILLS